MEGEILSLETAKKLIILEKIADILKHYKALPYSDYDVDDLIMDLDYALKGGYFNG